MAENHPVGFQWVVEAQRAGREGDPRRPALHRTSAMADIHVPIRAGTDIAFLGGIINHIIGQGRDFREYVTHYTNASFLVSEDFEDTEDLDGIFSGWDPDANTYLIDSWQYQGVAASAAAGHRDTNQVTEEETGGHGAPLGQGSPESDPTLDDPRCVFRVLERHFSRYTPAFVEETCGVPQELFTQVADLLCDNSGPERTGAFVYSVGWTQHTVGVQYIRTASIIQLLLGNVGRPGGGISPFEDTPASRGPPTSPPCTTSCRATFRCPRWVATTTTPTSSPSTPPAKGTGPTWTPTS
jgi:formate dehydrogenase major subunit